MTSKPVLYHCPQSRGGITLWMNEELGDVCDVRLINLRKGETQTPEYKAINPMAKIPSLDHDGVAVTEAAAICAYLADAFPEKGLAPAANDPKRGAYFRWMFFAPSVIEPMMLDKLGGTVRENTTSAGHGDPERVMTAIDSALTAGGPYLLGEQFSAADVVFGSTLRFATMFGAIEKQGAISDYVDRLVERPAAKRADEKNAAWAKEMGLE